MCGGDLAANQRKEEVSMEADQVMGDLRAYVRKTFEVPPDDPEFTDEITALTDRIEKPRVMS